PRLAVYRDLTNLFQHRLTGRVDPIVLGLQHTCFWAASNCQESPVNDLAGLVAFRPVVHAIDISVGEPKAFVMWVVLRFSSYPRNHRVAARHNRSSGSAQWKEDGLVVAFEIVGGEGM